MTTPEPTAATEPTDQPDLETAADIDAEAGDDRSKSNKEAAKYRRQLRDTETERDGLRDRVAGYERADVERIAGTKLQDGSDLWAAGVNIDDLRDDTGAVDPDKVTAACDQIVAQRPHWRKSRIPKPDPRQGPQGVHPLGNTPDWKGVIGGSRRG